MCTLLPAYGRDYKSKKAVLVDFNKGKDFVLIDRLRSTYANKQDLQGQTVKIRYDKNTKIIVHTVGKWVARSIKSDTFKSDLFSTFRILGGK